MGRDARRAQGLVCIMMNAPLTGCFGETVTMFIGDLFGNYLESKWF
ncbi:MAG: hypothetical protein MKZ54_00770 [Candidatus Poseidoniaceae archaeon]|nr:hypothetical protein [Candidatus Poseidoniaceae archaeon]